MKRLYSLTACILLCSASPIFSQQFQNGDLDGISSSSSNVPDFWENIPYTDPVCNAQNESSASPDVTGMDGPYMANGIFGMPHSGDTFVSALYGLSHHEGIQQLVTGFTPGVEYDVSFYQAVVKQVNVNAIDTTGSWMVYVDSELAGVSEMTTSNLSALEPDLVWEYRQLSFTALETSHTLKFLPADDDTVYGGTGENGMLRVGIDLISLSFHTAVDENSLESRVGFFPNPFNESFKVDLTHQEENVVFDVFNAQGQMVQQEQLMAGQFHDVSIEGAPGVYLGRLRDLSGDTATVRLVKK